MKMHYRMIWENASCMYQPVFVVFKEGSHDVDGSGVRGVLELKSVLLNQ